MLRVRTRALNYKEEFCFFDKTKQKEDNMAESKVIIPLNTGDDDFLAFSFCGKNSRQDFKLWRTSEGNRYNNNLAPTMNDKTAEIQGSDGVHFFRTEHKQKDFVINFAFDKLNEKQVREMKKWFSGKEMGDLWFAEEPYKVYTAKVTGQPNIKTLCFDVNGKREYRGEGSV
jgi:predicted phage tail component-like protein